MNTAKPSKQAEQALRIANDALELGQKQTIQIDAAKKMGYEANNKIDTHEQICALRAAQTLEKVGNIDDKLDKLISVLLGAGKIFGTVALTTTAGVIFWLVRTNGAV